MSEACSETTLAIGEPLLGSAGSARALLAIAWPKPLWHADEAARSTGLPPELATIEAREEKAGRKIAVRVFQREPGTPTDRVELICVAAGGASLQLRDLPAAQLPNRIESFLRGDAAGPRLSGRFALACTDGKHDRCCAAHGRAFYDALRASALEHGLEVAESSHLGGHRFAATSIVLPDGWMYGRLRADDAPAFAAAAAAGAVHLPRYRGRLGQPELAQVAEACALERFPAAQKIEIERVAEGAAEQSVRVSIWLADARHDLEVRCRAREFSGVTRCGVDAEVETRQRWVPVEVRER